MKRLLNIEWNKLFYNKGTRIFVFLYFAMIVAMGVILPIFKINVNGIDLNLVKMGGLKIPFIWHNLVWLIAFGKFFLAVILINNISNEYAFGTIKQNMIDGLSKKEFFASKLLSTLLLALGSTVFVFLIGLVLAFFKNENVNILSGSSFVLGYFVEITGYLLIAVFLSFLLKKSAFAILALFVLSFGETIVKGIEYFVRMNMQTGENTDGMMTLFSSYLPFNSNSSIVGYPSVDVGNYLAKGELFVASSVDWTSLGVSILYCFLFIYGSLALLKKRDL